VLLELWEIVVGSKVSARGFGSGSQERYARVTKDGGSITRQSEYITLSNMQELKQNKELLVRH